MLRSFTLPRGPGGVVLSLVVGLTAAACGRVSLGSMAGLDDDDDARAGAGGNAGGGSAGQNSLGGSDSGAGGASSSGGSTSGLGAATGLGGAGSSGGPGNGGTGSTSDELTDAGADSGSSARPLPASCRELDPQCGDAEHRASCCESLPVPGGSFDMPADISGSTVLVTVSSFHLDRFEVTVGRMREFIAHYEEWRQQGQPQPGLGEHPLIPGSGWQERFSPQLPASAEEFETRLRDCGPTPFSTYAEGLSDEVPLNCASWFEAAAFCAWDGARLPTLRELSYAAAGGALQRVYPWGDEPVPRRELALFGCIIDTSAPVCTIADVTPVGARPLGAGFFGQDDLAGSMSEWELDVNPVVEALPPNNLPPDTGCTDCADLGPDESLRRWRPGDWLARAELMKNGVSFALPPDVRNYFLGLRCARDE